MMDLSEVILRLSTASLIGAACGLNRNLHRKPTGVRTLGLVGFGSAFIVITFGQASTADASRVVQGVSSRELGSLARGVIVRNDNHCRVPCAWHYNCSMRLAHSVHRGSMRGRRLALSPHKPANRAGACAEMGRRLLQDSDESCERFLAPFGGSAERAFERLSTKPQNPSNVTDRDQAAL